MKTSCLALLVLLAGAIAPATRAQDEAPPPAQAPAGATPPAGSPAAPARPPASQGPPPGMFAAGPLPHGTVKDYKPVTAEMLLNPSPDDWLQFSRTYDAWRYSPLKQINRKNVSQLHIAWVKGLPAGTTETIPLVHDGIIYTIAPGSDVMAVDGANKVSGNLQGHDLLHGAGRLRGRARGHDRKSSLGNFQDRHPEYFWRD